MYADVYKRSDGWRPKRMWTNIPFSGILRMVLPLQNVQSRSEGFGFERRTSFPLPPFLPITIFFQFAVSAVCLSFVLLTLGFELLEVRFNLHSFLTLHFDMSCNEAIF